MRRRKPAHAVRPAAQRCAYDAALRDQMASRAMQAIVMATYASASETFREEHKLSWYPASVSIMAYNIADAMLDEKSERERGRSK